MSVNVMISRRSGPGAMIMARSASWQIWIGLNIIESEFSIQVPTIETYGPTILVNTIERALICRANLSVGLIYLSINSTLDYRSQSSSRHVTDGPKLMMNPRVPLQRSDDRAQWPNSESMRYAVTRRLSSLLVSRFRATNLNMHCCPLRPRKRPQGQASAQHSMRMSRPRAGSCDEPPTKLKRRVRGPGVEGPGPHPPPGPAIEAPSRSRRR